MSQKPASNASIGRERELNFINMKFIGVYDYTVIVTYLSLISGFVGMSFAFKGNLLATVICILISGVCDMFDGVIARTKKNRTQDEKGFGIQIDSLCDIICFGVCPSIFLYFSGLNSLLGISITVFYLLCGVIRLAFFNVLETNRQQHEGGCAKSYRGLPVTSAAIIYPLTYLICCFIDQEIALIVYHAVPVIMGLLFIADFRFPKIGIGKALQKKK